jgi:predicted thioredoxin/glutaredoxin
MLSEEEKREMIEMAASATLREEFWTLRKNSQALERRVSVDELLRWLTAMSRICPGSPLPRRLMRDTNMKI